MSEYKIVTTIPQEIFRAYDIRGIVATGLTPDNVYTIGLAIGSEAQDRGVKTMAIGRDGRLSGPTLLAALEAGLLASGCDVVNIGEVTTPIVYYAAAIMESQSGTMLSGSHNPPDYNGIKIVIDGGALFEEAIQKLYQRIINKDFRFGSGKVQNTAIIDDYIERVVSDVKLFRPMKIVIDCGNAVGGKVAPKLFRAMGCEVAELYCEVDGHFPNHHPDPSVPKNLQDLIVKVKSEHADLGFAFDGDADRVAVVTETGQIIASDRLLMLFALDFLTRHPGLTIVYDVKCTRNLAVQIKQHGGIPLMYKTGHSLIKAKMRELGTLISGELSGHIFIKERWFGFDDGIYVAARFLEILTKTAKTCSELFAQLPDTVNTPELKIAISEAEKFKFVEQLQKFGKFPGGEINKIDGVRVDYADGFGLLRASNTTPYLVLRFEGDTEAALERIQADFKQDILQINPNLQLPF